MLGFESPTGYEHIEFGADIEGYVLCYVNPFTTGSVAAYDRATFESGFGAPSTSMSPVKVTRNTSDGVLELEQTFTFTPSTRVLKIVMTVTNLTALDVSGVLLRRLVDFDIDAAGTNGWASTAQTFLGNSSDDAILAWTAPNDAPPGFDSHAVTLRNVGTPPSVRPFAKHAASISDVSCSPTPTANAGPIQGDDQSTLQYDVIGPLKAGKSKTFTVMYQR